MKNLLTLIVIGLLAGGCASTSDSKSNTGSTTPATPGDGWTKDKDIQKVWLAPGFDFSGYDTLYIAPTKYTAKERPNESEIRNWAVKYLTTAFADRIGTN